MFCLIDAAHVLRNGGFAKYVELLEDALVWEVQVTVAVSAIFLGGFLQRTLLGNVPLFMAVIAEVIAASALKEGMLNQTSTSWSQGHLIFGGHGHRSVGNMEVTYLFHGLYLFHPPLHPIHLHINGKQGVQQQLFLAL